jgi:hypothetical protein
MKKILTACIVAILLKPCVALAISDQGPAAGASDRSTEFLSVNVDRVEVDIVGLDSASVTLAASIDRLALALEQLSRSKKVFSAEERQILLDAVHSAREASLALGELAQRLPKNAQDMSEGLSRIISDAHEPIVKLSSGLQSASDSVAMIADSLPQATENANLLVNSALDAALQRLTLYTLLLVAIVALALIGIMWFIYRQYLQPLTRKLDEIVGAPEHFDNMARHMKDTAISLQALQCKNIGGTGNLRRNRRQ